MKTKNQLKKIFSDFASSHLQINSFGYGEEFEQQANETAVYPLMWVLPNASTLSGVQMNYSYRVIIADRVRKDESDEVDVESDTDLILKDCIAYLYKYALQNDLKLADGITFNPFWEKWSDEVSGAYIDVVLEDYFDYDSCNIPLADEIPQGEFPDVNGIYISPSVFSKALTIPQPVITDDIPIFYTYSSIQIREIADVLSGTNPSLTYNIYFAEDKNEASPSKIWTTDRTATSQAGSESAVIDTKIIPKDNWVWIEYSNVSGVINIFSFNIFYKTII